MKKFIYKKEDENIALGYVQRLFILEIDFSVINTNATIIVNIINLNGNIEDSVSDWYYDSLSLL